MKRNFISLFGRTVQFVGIANLFCLVLKCVYFDTEFLPAENIDATLTQTALLLTGTLTLLCGIQMCEFAKDTKMPFAEILKSAKFAFLLVTVSLTYLVTLPFISINIGIVAISFMGLSTLVFTVYASSYNVSAKNMSGCSIIC